MSVTPLRTYKGQGIQPAMFPEEVKTEAARFRPGTYAAGLVVGQTSNVTAANDVQTLTETGTPTGGTFRLAFNGVPTANLNFNCAASDVQAALAAIPAIGTGNVVCAGGPFPGTPITVTFQGAAGNNNQPLLTLFSNALTGGATPTVTPVHTTPGRAAGGDWANYDNTQSDGTDTAKGILEYDLSVDNYGNHIVGGGEWGTNGLNAPVYVYGWFRTADMTGLDAPGITDLGRIVLGSSTTLANVGTVLKIN